MIKPGKLLFTKDGRKIGNAIILGATNIKDIRWEIETDFGNRVTLSESELRGLFHFDYINEDALMQFGEPTVAKWRSDRDDLRLQNKHEDMDLS